MLRILRHYARALRRGEQLDRDVDRELRFHLEMEAEKHLQQGGLPVDDARNAALRRFGGVQKTQEECRDERNVTFVDNLRQDVRYGARSLRRSPGFAIAAPITIVATSRIVHLHSGCDILPRPLLSAFDRIVVDIRQEQSQHHPCKPRFPDLSR